MFSLQLEQSSFDNSFNVVICAFDVVSANEQASSRCATTVDHDGCIHKTVV